MNVTRCFCFIILVLVAISCERNPYEVEDKLYQCMVDQYAEKKVDLDLELEKFETYLIDERILESKRGKSYEVLFDELIDSEEEQYIDWDRFYKLREIKPKGLYSDICLENLDSNIIKSSKFYELNIELKKNIIPNGKLDADSVRNIYKRIITEDEYNHSYYKARILLVALYVFDIEAGIPPTLNGEIKGDKFIGYSDFKIHLTDVIILDNEEISLDKLKIKLGSFIDENSPNYTISIYQQGSTTYELYINIQNLIVEVINKFRNEKSIELYGMPFLENTNKEEVLEIKEMFPENILEPQINDAPIFQ